MLNDNDITNTNEDKTLGIHLSRKLNFERYISSLFRKVGQKMITLTQFQN